MGTGIACPSWAQAQNSRRDFVDSADAEAAPPAGSGRRQVVQYFPSEPGEDGGVETQSYREFEQAGEASLLDSDTFASENDPAWSASERFSRRKFLDVIPVQYPLDNSAYEGEDPIGREPKDAEGDWRSSSVDRPAEELALEEQPWIDWYKVTLLSQTLPSSSQGLGITSFDLRGTLKFGRWPFLFVTPRAGLHSLSGPSTPDLPAQLYDFSLDTTVYLPLNDRWTVQLSAAPSVFSDFQASKNAFRMVGRGLVFYRWSPELQLAGGFLYLGRKDIVALPAAGFIYTPNDDLKYDIIFPKPRIGYRYTHNEVRERWVYTTGELGGGSWAVQRTSGADDVATIRDYQLLMGIEHKQPNALNWQIEAGYVFSRKLEYLSSPGVYTQFPSTAVLRVIMSF